MGGAKIIRLLERFGDAAGITRASSADLQKAGLEADVIEALHQPDEALLATDRQWLEQPGHHLVTWQHDAYPALLRDVPSPPAALFVDGDPDLLWSPQVAVIGSRNPTSGGVSNARDFASELSRQGIVVTSGMAAGIDSVAHEAALDSGSATLAVLGTGTDVVYPRSAETLAGRIRKSGALVSEFPPGTQARRSHFPTRNRIISGLSLGVLVIEAGLNSGTLITARAAGNQGREVFALPGSIHNPMAKGCHRLIRDGARLVENITEIMQELAPLAAGLAANLQQQIGATMDGETRAGLENAPPHPQFSDDPEYQHLWACLGYDPIPVDKLIEESGLTARAVSAMLLMLELRGMVEAHPGGAYSRK
jgi:DNA processing protein